MQNIDKNKFFDITRFKIKEKLNLIDQKIINLSLILNKLPNNINELYEELKIITDLKYPNIYKYLNIKQYCEFCILNEIKKEELIKINIPNRQIKKIIEIIKLDIGVELKDEEIKIIKVLSRNILYLIETKENIETTIEKLLSENYPNLYKIATTKIACKMLEISGSLERLARMPSSTIQMLGSEKSFFKALKRKTKTPKYGIIYTHPLMENLSIKDKAKFARTLAAKISIAAKSDLENNDISKDLEKKIEKKIKILKNK